MFPRYAEIVVSNNHITTRQRSYAQGLPDKHQHIPSPQSWLPQMNVKCNFVIMIIIIINIEENCKEIFAGTGKRREKRWAAGPSCSLLAFRVKTNSKGWWKSCSCAETFPQRGNILQPRTPPGVMIGEGIFPEGESSQEGQFIAGISFLSNRIIVIA